MVFEIPNQFVNGIEKDGNLGVSPWGYSGFGTPKVAGIIRTYP